MALDEFNFPVKPYLQQLMREQYPDINSQPGSAFHDLILVPVAAMFQNAFDRINIMKQSVALTNYSVMTQEEMDRRASNFFIERRTGVQSYGTVRIYVTTKKVLTITDTTYFYNEQSLRWTAITPKTYSIENMTFDPTRAEYFIDVPVQAEVPGEEYTLTIGDELSVTGIQASLVVAINNFVTGVAADTNTDLFNRIQDAITNNELVKPSAIKKILQEQFATIRNLAVIGYGDAGMQRDVINVSLPLEDMFGTSECYRVNLPLDADGNVNWYDNNGQPVLAPIGGWAGAIWDASGKDFNDLPVTWDGQNYTHVSVQPGFIVRFFDNGSLSDPDAGDYYVYKVEEVSVVAGGAPVKVIRLSTPLSQTSLSSTYKYKLLGNVGMNSFHVGGKVDIVVDDTSTEELDVVVSNAPEIDPAGSNVIEIPLVDYQVYNNNSPIFDDNITFVQPVLSILRVAQVSYGASTNELKVLVPFRDYTVVSAVYRSK